MPQHVPTTRINHTYQHYIGTPLSVASARINYTERPASVTLTVHNATQRYANASVTHLRGNTHDRQVSQVGRSVTTALSQHPSRHRLRQAKNSLLHPCLFLPACNPLTTSKAIPSLPFPLIPVSASIEYTSPFHFYSLPYLPSPYPHSLPTPEPIKRSSQPQ